MFFFNFFVGMVMRDRCYDVVAHASIGVLASGKRASVS